jgi:branched-subunit amino acid transport protein
VIAWIAILAVGAGSFAMRVGPLLVLHRAPLGERADRVVRRAGLAAIAALVTLSTKHATTTGSPGAAIASLAVATVLAIRGASMARLVLVGVTVYGGWSLVAELLSR